MPVVRVTLGMYRKIHQFVFPREIGEIDSTIHVLPPEVGITTVHESFSDAPEESSSSEKQTMPPEVSSISKEVNTLKDSSAANVRYLSNPCGFCCEGNSYHDTQFQDVYQIIGTWDPEEVGYRFCIVLLGEKLRQYTELSKVVFIS